MRLSYPSFSLRACASVAAGFLLVSTLPGQTSTPASTPPAAAPAPAVPAGPHTMTPDDVAGLKGVGGPVVSPDGQWVAYTVSHVDTKDDKSLTELWMVKWDGSVDLQLTRGKSSAGGARWSPDGRYLAFTSGREGEAKGSQVWVLDRRGGEAYQLTDVKQDLGGFDWSPDSQRLVLQLTEKEEPEPKEGEKPPTPKPIVIDRYHYKQDREGFLSDKQPHLYFFELSNKKLTKVTNFPVSGAGAVDEGDPAWSPDGKHLAFVSPGNAKDPDREDNPDVWVVDVTGNAVPKQLTTFEGPDVGPLVWTADSKRVIFREGVTPHYSIYNMPRLASVGLSGGAPEFLTPGLDQWVGEPVTGAEHGKILFSVDEDRNTYIAELEPGHKNIKRLTLEPGSARGVDAAAGHIALTWTTDAKPGEVYALEGTKLRVLTHHNDAWVAGLKLAPTTDLSAKADDGNEVHSLLTMPVGYVAGTKVPMLLRIHGGPTGQDEHGFNVERQMFAGHGFAVLNVNYRGSTGRGHEYSFAINADWGDKEVKDLLASVDAAVATGNIDADKMGVGGWSYGGILTDYTIASTTRFKGASSGAGVANIASFYGVDQYILQYQDELGAPWKNPDLYMKLSYPFFHADRIKTPTLFMGGDKDFNVPLQGGEQMYEALKALNVPTELIVYPGEFHGFNRPSFIKDRWVRWLDWYDRYVKGIEPAKKPDPAPKEPEKK